MQVAESALILNAMTQGLFNANLQKFFTGGGNPGTDGSLVISLPEILGAGPGGVGGNYHPAYGKGFTGLSNAVKRNLKDNGAQMAMQVIGIPIGFKIAGALLKKPRRQMNSIIKQIGLNGVKV